MAGLIKFTHVLCWKRRSCLFSLQEVEMGDVLSPIALPFPRLHPFPWNTLISSYPQTPPKESWCSLQVPAKLLLYLSSARPLETEFLEAHYP